MDMNQFKPDEQRALQELAQEQGLSEFAVLRQALRLYQRVHIELKRGHRMEFIDAEGKVGRDGVAGLGTLA